MTIIHDKDLPARMKERHDLAHRISREAFEQIWNQSIAACHKIDRQISGNDALSYLGTIISALTARWLVEMDKIAKDDTAGVGTEELVKTTLNGIVEMLGGKAEFEKEKELPDGIKRLRA